MLWIWDSLRFIAYVHVCYHVLRVGVRLNWIAESPVQYLHQLYARMTRMHVLRVHLALLIS